MSKHIPPQSLSWLIKVEPYPAVSYLGKPFIADIETWAYTAYDEPGHWQVIERNAFGRGDAELATLGRWDSVEDLEASVVVKPPEWLLAAIRAIEATS